MMIDTSALMAIALREAEGERMAEAIAGAASRLISCVNWLELLMVAESRLGPDGASDARLLLASLEITPVPLDAEQSAEAFATWRRYGKGRHPAALNLGDCCAYAASTVTGEPLLYKGEDFRRTDVARAEW